MSYVTLIRQSSHLYGFHEADTVEMSILGCFLTDDVGSSWPAFKEWALDDTDIPIVTSNATALEKKEDMIQLSDLYEEEESKSPFLSISKREFVRIINEWEELYKQKPNKILITQDDKGKITLETKD